MDYARQTSPAQAKAVRKYRSNLLDSGHRPINIWLSDDAIKRLDQLAIVYGSRPKVIEALLGG